MGVLYPDCTPTVPSLYSYYYTLSLVLDVDRMIVGVCWLFYFKINSFFPIEPDLGPHCLHRLSADDINLVGKSYTHTYPPHTPPPPHGGSLYPYCILAVPLLYPGCILTVSWLYPYCILAVSLLYPGCILTVSWLYPDCILAVSLLYPGCTLTVSWLYPDCILAVPLLYPGCILTVSWLYPYCILAVS